MGGFDVCAYPGERSNDPLIDAAFQSASEWVKTHKQGVDGFLKLGSLDCSNSIYYLEQGIGRRCVPWTGIWAAEDVAALAKKARWPDESEIAPEELWAYWSACKFLEVCVSEQLGIWFV